MWDKWHGFVITEQEVADNNAHLQKYGYAPKLDCWACKGGGSIHPVVGSQVQWNKIMPCPKCLPEQNHAYKMQEYGVSDRSQG